jgi:hypothetical protein
MKTKIYDLNLYIIDGELRVLAHELELATDGHVQTGSNFHVAYSMPVFRRNERLWRQFLEFFDEPDMYNELDSWYGFYPEGQDYDYTLEFMRTMPIELALSLKDLPEYEVA